MNRNATNFYADRVFRAATDTKGCFVAGTLVHTDKGLVPIQDLKVGDKVLSKSEGDPNGKLGYQKITETHKFENKSIYLLRLVEFSENDATTISEVFSTPNHPFWKVDVGWTRADLLRHGDEVILANGNKAIIFEWSPVLRTSNTNVGWVAADLQNRGDNTDTGYLVDFSHNKITTPFNLDNWEDYEYVSYWDYAPEDTTWMDSYEERRLNATVYNITVENTHTYFVGEDSIWVHSANCHGEFPNRFFNT
ncbi:Hint domain-containing protein [Psychrobacter sp. Ps6]|uniref:polymorphic toxin-type HINT domain-containing protein n=1 Tax=Psychrobacter sp. Ps6 TaxID=2790960 RepID=UPI001EDECFAA|nr:Hint domain-containing protein [Psychrobacter sp. Ps6]MCG3877998.1 hypothetical protein [Psychrobacter sp. Ps6]